MNIKLKSLFVVICLSAFSQVGLAQRLTWPEAVRGERFHSSLDNSGQMAMFYASRSGESKPLIVILHQWKGGYKTISPLIQMLVDADWNFIQPHLRGPSSEPLSCASPTAMSDIADAIAFAVRNADVDMDEIHIVGLKDGGHNALAAYATLDIPIKSVSAWAGVSDLLQWYNHIIGTKSYKFINFSDDMLSATGSTEEKLNKREFNQRSPIKMRIPAGRKKTKLLLVAGNRDGKKNSGPVPPSQSVEMFNYVAGRFDGKKAKYISEEDLAKAVKGNAVGNPEGTIAGRKILLHASNKYEELIIFEGGHEMFYEELFARIPVNEKYR